MVTFDLCSLRFHLSARSAIRFPEGSAGNVLRGALGAGLRKIHCAHDCPGWSGCSARECKLSDSCRYARIFEPAAAGLGPSGLANRPRPFVIRAAHLNGKTIAVGESFWFDINLFENRELKASDFAAALDQFAAIESLDVQPVSLSLNAPTTPGARVRVEFRTPTELKGAPADEPNFAALFARAQDRVSTLRQFYGAGPVAADFCAMRARAAEVRMTRCELQDVLVKRRSSRTGQVHGIGGFVGMAEYEGPLGEFLPYLEAAHWTGVGRQCVWGKGELRVETLP